MRTSINASEQMLRKKTNGTMALAINRDCICELFKRIIKRNALGLGARSFASANPSDDVADMPIAEISSDIGVRAPTARRSRDRLPDPLLYRTGICIATIGAIIRSDGADHRRSKTAFATDLGEMTLDPKSNPADAGSVRVLGRRFGNKERDGFIEPDPDPVPAR